MKNKLFLLLAIIAVLGIAMTLNYGMVWAQEQEGPMGPFEEGKAPQIRIEFSTYYPDVDADGTPDPQQVLFTKPTPQGNVPQNSAFDFSDTDTSQVDALANSWDHKFRELQHNRANLLVSFKRDPRWNGAGNRVAVYMEDIGGIVTPKWSHPDLDINKLTLPGLTPPDTTRELDALEVWGPDFIDDANCFSLYRDRGDTSVWTALPPTQPWKGYIPHLAIVNAVKSASLDTAGGSHYIGPDSLVDLDALMVWDRGVVGVWQPGDTIIFSIRAAGNWDGGEIVVLPFGGQPRYLNHGGHLWHTPFTVATKFHMVPSDTTEEVDAIESYPEWFQQQTPTLTGWGLIILVALLIASTVFVLLKKRKTAVPA